MISKDKMDQLVFNTKKIGHFHTLLGERKSGSTWGREFTEEDFFGLRWQDDTERCIKLGVGREGCKYYWATSFTAFPEARKKAVKLQWFRKNNMMWKIKVAEGAHGPELQCDDFNIVDLFATESSYTTETATMITGEHEGMEVIFTIHPGEPLLDLPKDFDGDLTTLDDFTAVKLVGSSTPRGE